MGKCGKRVKRSDGETKRRLAPYGGEERRNLRETLRQSEYDFLATRVLFFLNFLLSPKLYLLTKRLKLSRFALEND